MTPSCYVIKNWAIALNSITLQSLLMFIFTATNVIEMNKLKIVVLLLACFTLTIYACKKETLNDHDFVQKHFVGKWPLKSRVVLTIRNKDTLTRDTTRFSPIDTLLFTADNKYTKGLSTGDYTIDEKGENLTISIATTPPTPPIIWRIEYLRQTSIILVQRTFTTEGTDRLTTHVEENLVK